MGFYQKMAEDRKQKKLGIYKVLELDMVKSSDRERARTIASLVSTGEEAYKLAGHDDFSYRDLDMRRRCGVVLYKGIEVLLLFKRSVIEREPGPGDPVPEKLLSEPKEAWIQVDLLATAEVSSTSGDKKAIFGLQDQVQRLQMLWKSTTAERDLLKEQLDNWRGEREELKILRTRYPLLEQEKKMQEKEIEGLRAEVKREKAGRAEDKVSVIRELFPVFNTTWLAGLYRVGDQLYDMIKKQLVDGLGKIGVKLIEPTFGAEFNPAFHNALHAIPFDAGSKEIGRVVNVHRVGMMLSGGRIVEAAEVSVGTEKAREETSDVSKDLEGTGSNTSAGEDLIVEPTGESDSREATDVGPVGLQDTGPVEPGR
jgi:molecular chaperone GrpE (heat shock protein)